MFNPLPAKNISMLNRDSIRNKLGLVENVLTVNAGSNGPLCEAAWQAIEQTYRLLRTTGDPTTPGYIQLYEQLAERDRREVAKLLHCAAEDIALCESTTAAMNILLWGLELKAGDEIITTSLENPAAMIPLRVCAQRSRAILRVLELGNGEVDIESLFRQQLGPRTRVVLASDVNCLNGVRLDLPTLTRVAHEHGVLVFGDGVQAAGTCPIDVASSGIDAYALARHKFLCGPAGAGALYINRSTLDHIKPTFTGCFSDASHGDEKEFLPFPDARRFEISTRSLPDIAGASAAMDWMANEIGWPYIYAMTTEVADSVRRSLHSINGITLHTPDDAPGALTAFSVADCNTAELVTSLKQQGVFTRVIRMPVNDDHADSGNTAIRLSLGFWNHPDDAGPIASAISRAIDTCR